MVWDVKQQNVDLFPGAPCSYCSRKIGPFQIKVLFELRVPHLFPFGHRYIFLSVSYGNSKSVPWKDIRFFADLWGLDTLEDLFSKISNVLSLLSKVGLALLLRSKVEEVLVELMSKRKRKIGYIYIESNFAPLHLISFRKCY